MGVHYIIWLNKTRVANTQSLVTALQAPYNYMGRLVEAGRLRVERVDTDGTKRTIIAVDLDHAPSFAKGRE